MNWRTLPMHLTPSPPVFIDDLDRSNPEKVEAEADAMAQEALIPEKSWRTAKCGKHCSLKTPSPSPMRSACIRPSWQDVCATKTKNFRLLSHLIGKTGQVSQILDQ
jgi:HTH-type transcriptional regulator/antitoxin HigA